MLIDLPNVTQSERSRLGLNSQPSDSTVYALLLSTTLHYLHLSRISLPRNRGQVLCLLQMYLVQDGPVCSHGVVKTQLRSVSHRDFCVASEKKKQPRFQLWHIHSVITLFWSGVSFLFNLQVNQNVTCHKSCEILSLPWKYDS